MTNLNNEIGLSEKEDSITSPLQQTTQVCKGCKEILSLNEYYTSPKNKYLYYSKCKKCHNKVRKTHHISTPVKKLKGFQKLSMETQKSIIIDMFYYNKFKVEQGWDYNISKIIKKYNEIKYNNFMNWIKKGEIPTYIENL